MDVKNYLNEFPDRIKKPVRFEYSEAEASLLEVAIMKRKPEVVELLLEKGADVNQAENPILLACRPIDRLENKDLEIIHHLLRFGANPNAYQEEPWLETALLLCVTSDSEEAFNLLLTHGANPNPLQSLNDDNQLEMCKFYFKNKKFRFLEMLLKHGFDLNRCYKGGVYPLHITLMDQNYWVLEIVEKLAGRADFNIKTEDGGATPLHLAVSGIGTGVVKKIVICLMSNGANPEITGCLPKSCDTWNLNSKALDAFRMRKSVTALDIAEDRVQKIMLQQVAKRRLQAAKPDAGDSVDSDREPDGSPPKAVVTKKPSLFNSLVKNAHKVVSRLKITTEPSAPPREEGNPPSEQNMPVYNTRFYNAAYSEEDPNPPPYSEEDPNPTPNMGNKRF